MGLIAIAGILACLMLVGGVSVALRYLFNGRASRASVIGISLLIAGLGWAAFNFRNVNRQRDINAVMKDCGWKVYKTVAGVDGIYIESGQQRPAFDSAAAYLTMYPAVQYSLGEAGVQELRRSPGKMDERRSLDQRTFRYGFRSSAELVRNDVRRETTTFLDFDTGEILAEDIMYFFDDHHAVGLKDLLLVFVTYQNHGCGWIGSPEREARFHSVLQPGSSLSR